jgi:hypothetical protein
MTNATRCQKLESPDRRRAPRVSCRRPLHVVSGCTVWSAEVQDISETGLRLGCSERPLPPQGRLKIFISLPSADGAGNSLCLLEGEVVWVDDRCAGLRLIDPADEHRDCLRRLLS